MRPAPAAASVLLQQAQVLKQPPPAEQPQTLKKVQTFPAAGDFSLLRELRFRSAVAPVA
jgi:hypothetical protein